MHLRRGHVHTRAKATRFQQLGFALATVGPGHTGTRYWWKRVGSEITVVSEKTGREKHQDLGDTHPKLPAWEDTQANAAWALDLVRDDEVCWH